jgi:glycosyltransferase 2 family protein
MNLDLFRSRKYYSSLIRKRGFLILMLIMVFYISFALYSDINKFITHLQKIDLKLLVLILLLFATTIFIKSIRQYFFLRQINIQINFKENIIIFLAGLSMLVTPGGLGQMIKSHFLLKKDDQPVAKTIPLVIVERYHDVLALFCFMVLLSVVDKAIPVLTIIPILIIGIFLLALMIMIRNYRVLGFFQQRRFINKIPLLRNLEEKSYSEFKTSLSLLFKNKSIVYGWLYSIAAWSFEALGIFLCFKALGLNISFILSTVFGFSSVLFGAVSFLPGGAGLTEVIFVHILSSHGIELSMAITVVIFYRLSSIWFSTAIGLIALRLASKKGIIIDV